ncbi:pirin family protein [Archangium lansingense]|uniref:Pirin family protein n=1 Tax=Archangium lansingense TaxID=2995310 RepID=A0ABT4A292_9BACT|nr:pirin family protein [Archangium lansinium]MCY1075716.1 pirin family protein [Archangium lansinium]
MKLGRRALVRGGSHLLGLAALGCSSPPKPAPAADVRLRPLSSLPVTELPWLRLRDHFIATVGPHAGKGRPLGSLLVLADATFAPRSRFPLHPHREMEILSIVLSGELSHHGDQSHGATLRPREAQLISARDGMVHAEGNETDEDTRMLQLWFTPEQHGGAPAYFRRSVPPAPSGGRHLMAGDEEMPLRSDARVWWLDLAAGQETAIAVAAGRAGYLLSLDAPVQLGEGRVLARGEGAQLNQGGLTLRASQDCGALWIDVAA